MLHWSDSSDFDMSKKVLKEADLLSGRRARGESAETGREQEREEQLRGKSQVTKTRHIPAKPFYHITMLHHTGYNELMLCEGCPYLHAHPSRLSEEEQIRASS